MAILVPAPGLAARHRHGRLYRSQDYEFHNTCAAVRETSQVKSGLHVNEPTMSVESWH